MANTVKIGRDGNITIVPDGATDFDIATYHPHGIYLRSIMFYGSASSDVLKVRSKVVDGAIMVEIPSDESAGEPVPKRCFPYIKAADCTFGTPGSCLIIIDYN